MSASEDGRLGRHTHLAWSALFLHPQGPAVVGGVGSAPGMPEGGPRPPVLALTVWRVCLWAFAPLTAKGNNNNDTFITGGSFYVYGAEGCDTGT